MKISYPKLNEDKMVDVLIVGGGITGVNILYQLRKNNLNVMLVEQNKIGFSVTGKSTGKLSYLQNDLIDKIRKGLGDEIAAKYVKSQRDAIKMAVEIINKEKIACDLEKVNSVLYTNKDSEISKIKSLESFLRSNGVEVKEITNNLVQSKYIIEVSDTYMFHPVKFVYGLLKNNKFPIYENTTIKEITKVNDYYLCSTKENEIKAKWVILASHYPYFIVPYLFPIKCSLEKSYLSLAKFETEPLSLISYSNPFVSIRTYKDNLIYLSNSHSVNSNVCDRENYNELLKKVSDLGITPDYMWSNIDIITNDGLPYVGKLSGNLLIGTGYNTWGLTNGILAGKILSDIVMNKENEYEKLFSPTRKNMKQVVEGIKDVGKTIGGYVNGFINSDRMYKCPHAYCNLIYNEIDDTFDCPCHGSRFDNNGKCISGPANKDIDIR